MQRPGPPDWGLGAGLRIHPYKSVIVTKPQRGGQGPNWAVEPYDDDVIKIRWLMFNGLNTVN
jgi:hypothetical protein